MVKSLATTITLLIALQHLGFLILEMFLWQHKISRQIFHTSVKKAEATATLAANQGLYNGFLSIGLLASVLLNNFQMQIFLLACVFTAGCYGAYSVSRSILWIQGLPALIALLLLAWTTP